MPNTITAQTWLRFLDEEYLSTFVRDGGASIKFAVVSDRSRPELYTTMQARCRELDYLFIKLDAAGMRAHMPQDIFFGLATQIDWRVLARRMILRLAKERDYGIEDIDPRDGENIFRSIAELNGSESQFVLSEIRPEIMDRVFKNKELSKDFRVCMSHLCLLEYTRGEYTGEPLLEWVTGRNPRIGNVRPFSIYTSINRTTARHFIESALFWVQFVGYTGTVVMLDNSRVTLNSNPRDDKQYYTKAMAVDHYELLREFIDGVDRLCGTLLVVITNDSFLDEHGPRSYKIYPALHTRIMNDVRDRNLANPMASLVRLSSDGS